MAKREKKHKALPVAGYSAQSDDKVDMVNHNKAMEERILRRLDYLNNCVVTATAPEFDRRWLAIARTHIEQGFMAMNRAVFQPARVKLPEDDIPTGPGGSSE
jgi:hypothetical protein